MTTKPAVALAAIAIALTGNASGQSVILQPTTLGTLPRPYTVVPVVFGRDPAPLVLNDYGQVVAFSTLERSALLWTPSSRNGTRGGHADLSSLGFLSSGAMLHAGLNSRGQIAAGGLLWSPTAPNGTSGATTRIPGGGALTMTINDFGQVLADHMLWTPSEPNGSVGTAMTDDRLVGAHYLNNFGQVLTADGLTSRLFTPAVRQGSSGTFIDFPLPGTTNRWPAGINDDGTVAVYGCGVTGSVSADDCRVFVWIPDAPNTAVGKLTQLQPPPGVVSMTAMDINNAGHIVGMARDSQGITWPFLYADGVVYDLSAADAVLATGAVPSEISNAGQILFRKRLGESTLYSALLMSPTTDAPAVTLALSQTEVSFSATSGPQRLTHDVRITLTGADAASTVWSTYPGQAGVFTNPWMGVGSGSFQLYADTPTSPGRYERTLYVRAGTQTQSIRVVIDIPWPSTTRPPFGVVDLPRSNAAVSGAIGVTGWALDDVGVARIEVWRKAVPGEPNMNGQVYVGEGIFVDGARPDVAAANPGVPYNTRGGWGMQILTNMLPNTTGAGNGNGQHQLFVYAVDREGKSTLLGSPVILVNNAAATRPFGTIATPASGGLISGSLYTVFGWALTPQPAMIPFDGSTIWVFVDGVSQGHPTYNQYRADIATLFPGLQNSNGGVGYYHLDTTRLANGMHSIAWSVTDNLNRIEGIGSRLFFVQNPGVAAASSGAASKGMRSAVREGMWFRTGYDPAAQMQKLEGNVIEVKQGGRIELHVGGAASVEFDGNASLLLGSTFEDGVFYWQLDTAYIASYELKFRDVDGVEIGRVAVRVNCD